MEMASWRKNAFHHTIDFLVHAFTIIVLYNPQFSLGEERKGTLCESADFVLNPYLVVFFSFNSDWSELKMLTHQSGAPDEFMSKIFAKVQNPPE